MCLRSLRSPLHAIRLSVPCSRDRLGCGCDKLGKEADRDCDRKDFKALLAEHPDGAYFFIRCLHCSIEVVRQTSPGRDYCERSMSLVDSISKPLVIIAIGVPSA